MSDKRTNNGGHSTKATSKHDKRCNPSKKLLEQYINEEFDYTKMKKLFNKLLADGMNGDTKSTTLFLAYVLGKPTEHKEISLDNDLAQVIVNLGNGKK